MQLLAQLEAVVIRLHKALRAQQTPSKFPQTQIINYRLAHDAQVMRSPSMAQRYVGVNAQQFVVVLAAGVEGDGALARTPPISPLSLRERARVRGFLVTDRQNARLVRGHKQVKVAFFRLFGLGLFEQ